MSETMGPGSDSKMSHPNQEIHTIGLKTEELDQKLEHLYGLLKPVQLPPKPSEPSSGENDVKAEQRSPVMDALFQLSGHVDCLIEKIDSLIDSIDL